MRKRTGTAKRLEGHRLRVHASQAIGLGRAGREGERHGGIVDDVAGRDVLAEVGNEGVEAGRALTAVIVSGDVAD